MNSRATRDWTVRLPSEPEKQSAVTAERALELASYYGNLVSFEHRVLDLMIQKAGDLRGELRSEIESSTLAPMRDLIDSLEKRRAHWLSSPRR